MTIIDQARKLMAEVSPGWPVISSEFLAELPDGKIPFFAQVLHQVRDVNGEMQDYYNIVRSFGWAVVFALTTDGEVITLIQWKPGLNTASWEFAPGGIGKLDESVSLADIQLKTRDALLKETGYGQGTWTPLGRAMVESGKYRGASPDSHGFYFHTFLATGLVQVQEPRPYGNELIRTLLVPLEEIPELLVPQFDDSDDTPRLVEESAVVCAYRALIELNRTDLLRRH